jgi:glutathione S-transferase
VLKLYYAPHACSLSPHIALREAGLAFSLERVDFMRKKRLPDGRSLRDVHPKASVPVLQLESGEVLTEGVAILQYVADRVPERGLAPAAGSFARVRLQEWLNFIATELHKGISPLYGLDTPSPYKAIAQSQVETRLRYLARALGARSYLLDEFSVADAYLFYALRSYQRVTKCGLPAPLARYWSGLAQRPSVSTALSAEGIGLL